MKTEWKLVPVEPTYDMCAAGDTAYSWNVAKIYKAMLAATPQPPADIQKVPSKFVDDNEALETERDTLKAELTKARALLVEVVSGTGTSPGANKKYGAIRAYLSEKPTCRTCKGSGIEYDGAGHTCTACNGSGAPAAKDGE